MRFPRFCFSIDVLVGCMAFFFWAGGVHAQTIKPTRSSETEVVVFLKGVDLWLMDPTDRRVESWTKGGVVNYSISRNGKIAYDKFSTWNADFRDMNIYLSDKPGSAKRLTENGQSATPIISPDGTKIIYQRLEWDGGDRLAGRGRGLWLYDVEKGAHREIVGVVGIPPDVKEERNQQFASSRPGKMDENNWSYDSDVLWSIDSAKFLFVRKFNYGGSVTYWVDLRGGSPNTAILDATGLSPIAFGSTEAFFVDWGKDSLVAILPESGIRRRIAKDPQVLDAKLSSDGKLFVFTQQDKGGASIWAMNDLGENWRKLVGSDIGTLGGHDKLELDWSKDGSTVVATTVSEDGSTAWLIDTKTGKRRELGTPIDFPVFTTLSIPVQAPPKKN